MDFNANIFSTDPRSSFPEAEVPDVEKTERGNGTSRRRSLPPQWDTSQALESYFRNSNVQGGKGTKFPRHIPPSKGRPSPSKNIHSRAPQPAAAGNYRLLYAPQHEEATARHTLSSPTFYSTQSQPNPAKPEAPSQTSSIGNGAQQIWTHCKSLFVPSLEVSETSSMPPPGSLRNTGNTCFMNAALQAVADLLASHNFEETRIPDHIFAQLGKNSDNSLLYYRLRSDLLDLCNRLNGKTITVPSVACMTTTELMDRFRGSYVAYEQAKRKTAKREDDSKESILSNRQQDPQEFLDNICEVLELNTSDKSSLIQISLFSLEKASNTLFTRLQSPPASDGTGRGSDRSTLLILPVPKPKPLEVRPATGLEDCIDLFQEKSRLDSSHRIDWTNEELHDAGLLAQIPLTPLAPAERKKALKGTCDSQKIVWGYTGAKPPATLFALARLTGYDRATQQPILLAKQGKELLETFERNQHVTIPSYKASKVGGSGNYSLANEPTQQLYKIRSVVVHKGTKPVAGHYVTVKNTPEGYVVCDDNSVSAPRTISLIDMFKGQPVSGYLFALQAVED